jgi:hypothetical protein
VFDTVKDAQEVELQTIRDRYRVIYRLHFNYRRDARRGRMDDATFNSGYRFGVTDHGRTKVLNNSQEDSV